MEILGASDDSSFRSKDGVSWRKWECQNGRLTGLWTGLTLKRGWQWGRSCRGLLMPMTHVGALFFFLTPPKIASFSSKAVVGGLMVAWPSPSLWHPLCSLKQTLSLHAHLRGRKEAANLNFWPGCRSGPRPQTGVTPLSLGNNKHAGSRSSNPVAGIHGGWMLVWTERWRTARRVLIWDD